VLGLLAVQNPLLYGPALIFFMQETSEAVALERKGQRSST
jgi:hypothetical protein